MKKGGGLIIRHGRIIRILRYYYGAHKIALRQLFWQLVVHGSIF